MKKILLLGWWLLCVLLAPTLAQAQAFVPELNHIYLISNISPNSGTQYMAIGGDGTDQYQPDIAAYVKGDRLNEANRQWSFEDAGGGRFRIRNRNSQLYMEASGHRLFDYSGDVKRVVQNPYSGSDRQVWQLEPTGTNPASYVIRNYALQQAIRYVLAYGDDFPSLVVSNSAGFNWSMSDVSTNPSSDYYSSYFRLSNNNSYKVLTGDQGDNNNRSLMQVDGRNRSSEEWRFVPAATSGYYYLINRRNALVLEIGGGNTDNGATVNLWENYQHPWQEWAFRDVNDSHILLPYEFADGRVMKLFSRHAGKVLEIGGGSMNNGATANMWNDYSHPWQQWRMQFTSYNRPATTLATATASVVPAVSLYPNPATQIITLTALGAFDLTASTISLTDARGSAIKARYQNGQLDVSELAAGLYVLTVANSKQTSRQKFTKL